MKITKYLPILASTLQIWILRLYRVLVFINMPVEAGYKLIH